MNETYEGLRDSTSGEAGAAWKNADRQTASLREQYNALKDDPRYTEEYKSEKAWTAYENARERITAEREKARALAEREARSHYEMSLPRPKGETLRVGTPERLLAAQNQAARVVRMVERSEKRGKENPIGKPNRNEMLRKEYARGLEVGGVEGAIACKGALMAAEELGVDPESFLHSLRSPEDVGYLEKAQRSSLIAQSTRGNVPEPPFKKPHSGRLGSPFGPRSFAAARSDSEQGRRRSQGAPWAR